MNTINLKNYEMFAMDYLEGNLSAEQSAEMEAFLSQHPTIQSDFDLLQDPVTIQPELSIAYENKNSLYRNEEAVVVKLFRTKFFKMGIAASLLIGVMAIYLVNSDQNTSGHLANTDTLKINAAPKDHDQMQSTNDHLINIEALAEVQNDEIANTEEASGLLAVVDNTPNSNTSQKIKSDRYNAKPERLSIAEENESYSEVIIPEDVAYTERPTAVFASLETMSNRSVKLAARPVLNVTLPAVDQTQIDRFGLNEGIARLETMGLWSETVNDPVDMNSVKDAVLPEGSKEVIAMTNDVANSKTFQTYLTDLKDALLPESMVSVFNK